MTIQCDGRWLIARERLRNEGLFTGYVKKIYTKHKHIVYTRQHYLQRRRCISDLFSGHIGSIYVLQKNLNGGGRSVWKDRMYIYCLYFLIKTYVRRRKCVCEWGWAIKWSQGWVVVWRILVYILLFFIYIYI